MSKNLIFKLLKLVVVVYFLVGCDSFKNKREKPNILFIAIDDLNDWVGYLGGHPQAKTPNIDRLIKKGVGFSKAYTAAPLCNPSRVAILTGLYPSSTGVYGNRNNFRKTLPNKSPSFLTIARKSFDPNPGLDSPIKKMRFTSFEKLVCLL